MNSINNISMQKTIVHRFDKIFGPAGTSAGYSMIAGGIVILYFTLYGIVFILTGAFLAFTHSASTIDFSDKKFRFTNNLFGFLKFGKWIDITPDMKICIRKNNTIYRNYSRGNRTIDIKTHNFQLMLCDENNVPIAPVVLCKSISDAKINAENYAQKLDLKVEI